MSRREVVPIAYRPPFSTTPWCDTRQHGETVLEMVRSVPNLPRAFLSRGIVCINGEEVPRQLWSYVRPKPARDSLPIAVTLHWPLASPGGGRGGAAKSIIGIVAAIALIVVTQGIATGAVGGLLGISALSTAGLATTALAAAVGIAGALAISALTAPPTTQDQPALGGGADTNTNSLEAASASGNVISPGGSIPRVIGTRKIFPPFICEPVVELIEKDEFVEALVALNGPHLLEDIRVDNVSITDAEDVEYETREGWPSDTPITLIERQGRTITPQVTLSTHILSTDNLSLLHVSNPTQDLPVWHGATTRNSPDEVWMHLLFPGGISPGTTSLLAIPIRLRIRLRTSSSPVNAWINFPEIHVYGSNVEQLRQAIILKWMTTAEIPTIEPHDDWSDNPPWYYAHINVPPQTTAPATLSANEWDANSYFINGSGSVDYYNISNYATTKVMNFNVYTDRVEFYLDTATFTPGIYEIEIKRGAPYLRASLTQSTYSYGGTVKDFFWYASTTSPVIPQTRTNYSDRIALTRVISIWEDHPVQATGFALIAIKARNRQISRISVNASGYVQDLDSGSPAATWNTWTTTSNPAPHYVDILSGAQNLDPLPSDLRDDAGLIEWRTLCAANDWTCDAIIDDMRTQDALTLVASCAYAKPYQSDQYGVTVDSDVSGDSPIQVFSRINATNVRFEKAFARMPEGFVVTFRDESSDDDRAQTVVYQRDRSIATTGLLESISYEGLIEQDKVEARALFDLDQANQRSTFYTLETDIEAIVCRRGSLVALQHDVLTSRMGDAHVVSLTTGSPATRIDGLTLDATIPVLNVSDMHATTDMHAVTDMHLVGITTGIAIRRTDGTISTHLLSNATGDTSTPTFAVPIDPNPGTIIGYNDSNHEYGSLVVAGDLNSEYRRMLVLSIAPTKDLKASLTLVDEAPDLARF